MKVLLPLAAYILIVSCPQTLAEHTNRATASASQLKHLSLEDLRKMEVTEHRVEAGFLFNFTQFVEWPSSAFAKEDSPLVIGVLGLDPFGAFLDDTVRDELVKGHPIVVERYRKVEEIKICHILYIGDSEAPRLEHIENVLKSRPVLTVSDLEDTAGNGPVIRLMNEQNKIHLKVNIGAARAAELTISSKLLRAADVSQPSRKQ